MERAPRPSCVRAVASVPAASLQASFIHLRRLLVPGCEPSQNRVWTGPCRHIAGTHPPSRPAGGLRPRPGRQGPAGLGGGLQGSGDPQTPRRSEVLGCRTAHPSGWTSTHLTNPPLLDPKGAPRFPRGDKSTAADVTACVSRRREGFRELSRDFRPTAAGGRAAPASRPSGGQSQAHGPPSASSLSLGPDAPSWVAS